MKVKDIMTKDVFYVSPDSKITEVSKIFTEKRIHGLPVVDNGQIVGIITESDFFIKGVSNLYLPTYIHLLEKSKLHKKRVDKKDKEGMDKLLKAKASDVMTKNCLTVDQNMDTDELIEIFKEKALYTLPVVDDSNKMVGIITQADIIKLI